MLLTLEDIEHQYYTTVPIQQLIADVERIYDLSPANSRLRARAAVLRAICFVDQSQFEKSVPFFIEAKTFALAHNDKWILADAIHGEAIAPYKRQDFRTANMLEHQALEYAIQSRHRNREAVCYYTLGMIAARFESNRDAADYFGRALVIVQEQRYLRLEVAVLKRLSDISLQWKQTSEAKKLATQSLERAKLLGSPKEIASAKFGLIKVALEEQRYEGALNLIADIKSTIKQGDRRTWATVHSVLGHVYKATGQYIEAEVEYRSALEMSMTSEPQVQAGIHHAYAELYIVQGQFEEALKHLHVSMSFLKQASTLYHRSSALDLFHQCYKGLKQYKEAHEALEEYNTLISREQTDALNSRLEFHALKQEYEQTQLKAKEEERRAELLRIELERKDQDLVEKTKHLLKQTESLSQFRNDLKALVKRLPASDPMVQQVRERMRALPEEQLHWEDFDAQFKSLHPQFLHNLTTAFPDLTPRERKICPLLRLNLETDDIAKLLFLSERSIENHRYRIRQKLGLQKNQSLPDFLSKY